MSWENQDSLNKNLEDLRNSFSLENIMNSKILTEAPTLKDIGEGQYRMALIGGTLYKYTRANDTLYRHAFTAA